MFELGFTGLTTCICLFFSLPLSGLFGSKRIILHYMYLFCHLLPIFNFEMQLGILLETLTLICAICQQGDQVKHLQQRGMQTANWIKSKFGNQIKSDSHTKKMENRTKSNFWVVNSWFLVKLVLKITCVENYFNHFMRLCCYWS